MEIFEGQWFAWSCWTLSVTALIAIMYSRITKRGYYAWDIFFVWPLMGLVTSGAALASSLWQAIFSAPLASTAAPPSAQLGEFFDLRI